MTETISATDTIRTRVIATSPIRIRITPQGMYSRFGYTTPSKSQSIYPAPPKKSYAYEKFNKKYQQLRNKIRISSTDEWQTGLESLLIVYCLRQIVLML